MSYSEYAAKLESKPDVSTASKITIPVPVVKIPDIKIPDIKVDGGTPPSLSCRIVVQCPMPSSFYQETMHSYRNEMHRRIKSTLDVIRQQTNMNADAQIIGAYAKQELGYDVTPREANELSRLLEATMDHRYRRGLSEISKKIKPSKVVEIPSIYKITDSARQKYSKMGIELRHKDTARP